jgi:hypothetical protein
MQAPDSQQLPKTEQPEQPEPEPAPSIIGPTDTGIPGTKDEHFPHPLPPAEPMNEDALSPQPADSIAMQTEGTSEQASLRQQVRYH